MFDFNILKNLIVPEEFGSDEYNEATPAIKAVMEQLPLDEVYVDWGATQFVIINHEADRVAKIPFSGEFIDCENDEREWQEFSPYNTNYSYLTYELYQQAKNWEIIDLFAETEFFGTTKNGVEIYLQEKVKSYYDGNSRSHSSEASKKKYRELINGKFSSAQSLFPEDWLTAVIEWYGIDLTKDFLLFCEENNLDDFHTGNIGWREDGTPCVLDWAGFNEW